MSKSPKTKMLKAMSIKDMISFQGVFNILGIIFISFISIKLWTCLDELNALKHSADSVSESLSAFTKTHGINKRSTLETKKQQHGTEFVDKQQHGAEFVDIINGKLRQRIDKRSTLYDPLSSDPEDLDEMCWNFLYERCTERAPGAPASQGPPGPPGPQGNIGPPGRQGPMGHMGPPGINGIKGIKGENGDRGRTGEPGTEGTRGHPGLPGANGVRGGQGRRGKRGSPGRSGSGGQKGERGPPGLKGEKGDSFNGINEHGNCTCQKGEKGQRGLLGFTGYKGEKGGPGQKGSKGYGVQGFTGPRGPPGLKGEKGDPGYCTASYCGDKLVKEPYTVPEESTTPSTTSTTTTTEPTTMPTVPPSLAPRANVCRIKQVGKPVYVRQDPSVYGAWMRDPLQPQKIWLTRGYHGQQLEEYNSIRDLKSRRASKTYNLRYNRFYGTQHAIYNHSFYYHFMGKHHIVRYDLRLHDVAAAKKIPESHYNDSVYLYKDSRIYYDITADENGLWVIFGRTRNDNSNIYVMKLELETLQLERVWKLPVQNNYYGNGFIACGIVYLIQDTRVLRSSVSYSYDLYTDAENTPSMPMRIPFRVNTMVTFYTNRANRRRSVLLAWDDGSLLKYPLLF